MANEVEFRGDPEMAPCQQARPGFEGNSGGPEEVESGTRVQVVDAFYKKSRSGRRGKLVGITIQEGPRS